MVGPACCPGVCPTQAIARRIVVAPTQPTRWVWAQVPAQAPGVPAAPLLPEATLHGERAGAVAVGGAAAAGGGDASVGAHAALGAAVDGASPGPRGQRGR